MGRPVIAIAMGDPAGIGPELVVKVLDDSEVYARCRPFVVGAVEVLEAIRGVVGLDLRFRAIADLGQARYAPRVVDVLRPPDLDLPPVVWGKLDPAMGRAAAQCLRTAFELAMADQVQGVVAAPLNKEAFHLAGYDYLDDLRYLADLTGSTETYMMGVVQDAVWTVSITEHIPFRQIADAVVRERVAWHIAEMDRVLRQAGFERPRIAVAALNVHGGEGGLYGREEIDEIAPAIAEAQGQGITVTGPVPADTVYVRALAGEFDGVVSMYHDQANIARKLQPLDKRATLYMGLPVICGTTTHGTAFDKAGRGIAAPGSLRAALKYTVRLARAP
ncbi:MAG: 4-hydroxythreonine-4-phosphate dehydrogenase PdxA [Anaerolineae bacterium]|nr:4-hydroxythreonine-4-phosphate dehydrogenase PdxA [Anaerolineae bacterium]